MSKVEGYFDSITIGDHISELPKSKLPASAATDNGKYPFICSSSELKYTDSYLQEVHAVVMGTGGVATVHFGEGQFAFSTDTWAFRSKSTQVDTEFLYRKIQQLLPKIDYRAFEGSGLKHLRKNDIKRLKVEVPSDPAISKKILSILKITDQTIEKTESLIEKYQQIKAGLMHDLFTRGIGADGKLRPPRNKAPELYHESKIGWIPKVWGVHKLKDLALPNKGSTVIGPFGSDLVLSDYRSEGTPVIFVRDVKEDRFKWVSNTFVSKEKTQKLFAHKVKSGDILATKMGLPPCVSCTYPDTAPLGIITADMIRLSPDSAKVNTKWLSAAINQDRTKRQVAAITAGVTRPKVTLADFRNLKVAVPGTTEQQKIINILSKQWDLISVEESKTEKLKKLKSGLMYALLTGEKPVTVDEPRASYV